jgi:sialate O-acetylesterase
MTIAGKNKLAFKEVYVGEVWVCSGQSNMEMNLNSCADADRHKAESRNPKIRLFTVKKNPQLKPVDDVQGSWAECNPEAVGNFSGVGYFFGRDLQKALNVPVGLIHTSWGGTRAEAWTSREVLDSLPETKNESAALQKRLADYAMALEQWKEAQAKAKEDGKPLPKPPTNPATDANSASVLYNGMIHPLLPYPIKGAIWYQGESNAGKAAQYQALLSAMIKNWRDDWKVGDFPFLIVQLAPFMKIQSEPSDSDWARLREAQFMVSEKVPQAGEAVITDVGDEKDIHPKRKEPVGARLALAALGIAYGQKIEYSGPVFSGLKIDGDQAIVSFKHVGGGLVAKDGPLTGFTIAGEDQHFVNAEAVIQGDTVVVSSPKVQRPVAVRFGWANYPVVNLWNADGLPASPFRTDDFPMVTEPRGRGRANAPARSQ